MAEPLTEAQFGELVKDTKMLVFVVGREGKQYTIHRELIHSVTWIFDTPHNSDRTIDPNLRVLKYEKTERFDQFIAWLYDRNRYWILEDESDLFKLLKLYHFADTWTIEPLMASIVAAIANELESETSDLLAVIAKVHLRSGPSDRGFLADVLDRVAHQLVTKRQPSLNRLITIYIWAINWRSNTLKNIIIDAIRDVMHGTHQVVTVAQAKHIFRVCDEMDSSPDDERLRKLCIAIFHHRRFGFANGDQLVDYDAADFFIEIPNFLAHYMDFEADFYFQRISRNFTISDDPRDRRSASFPKCYFHVHDENNCEICHLED